MHEEPTIKIIMNNHIGRKLFSEKEVIYINF